MKLTKEQFQLFKINSRFTNSVLYKGKFSTLKLCVEAAVKSGADLRGAYLSDADLSYADLGGANLGGADLDGANLDGANLDGANLRGANLRGANLRGANLNRVDLSDADLCFGYLNRVDLDGGYLSDAPTIEDIHQKVFAAASIENALDMSNWHTCDTTHCRAGWVTTLAGVEGKALEDKVGTASAATLIYLKSDRTLERVPDFYCDNETALGDMKRLAEKEASEKSGSDNGGGQKDG